MPFSVNSTVLIGRLGRDPELRHTPSGTAVCNFSIAVDGAGEKGADGDDDRYGTGWFDIVTFGAAAESCAQYLSKGRQCGVVGRLQQRKWEDRDTGKPRSKVEVVANVVQFLGGRQDGDGDDWRGAPENQYTPSARAGSASPSSDFGSATPDSDIPF
jgi:single-strand DNA-binding protein